MNIFEIAARKKLRFPSVRGPLTAEDLWDLKLTRADGFCLDAVYKSLVGLLKEQGEDSLVATGENKVKAELQLKIELVKHVNDVLQAEKAERDNAASVAAEREKLTAILGEKQDEALKALTPDEIKARLAQLGTK